MNHGDYRKHNRGTTIIRYEDFNIHPEDQKKIDSLAEETSTKETPLQETPLISNFCSEMHKILESIQNRLRLEQNSRLEKQKSLRNKIIEEFFKSDSSPTKKKKLKKSNNSISKFPKKPGKIVQNRSKMKITEINPKKPVCAVPKLSKNIHRSMNLPKLSLRSIRTGSSNSDFKPSFLV